MPPDPAVEFVRAITPAFIAGMLALITALALFWFQQRSARRALRSEQLDRAFDHLMDGFRALQEGISDPDRQRVPEDLSDGLLRFAWHMGERDAVVAVWVHTKAAEAVRLTTDAPPSAELARAVGVLKDGIVRTLVRWRSGQVKRKWFREDLERVANELGIGVDEVGETL